MTDEVPPPPMMVRRYKEGDESAIGEIFYRAVHLLACQDYSSDQLNAWASQPIDVYHWRNRCLRKNPFVVEFGGRVVGFMELDPNGHIDCTYVDPDFARRGVMSRIMEVVKAEGRGLGLTRLFAEVSITGRPFFEHHGFVWKSDNDAEVRGQLLKNYVMHCDLLPIPE